MLIAYFFLSLFFALYSDGPVSCLPGCRQISQIEKYLTNQNILVSLRELICGGGGWPFRDPTRFCATAPGPRDSNTGREVCFSLLFEGPKEDHTTHASQPTRLPKLVDGHGHPLAYDICDTDLVFHSRALARKRGNVRGCNLWESDHARPNAQFPVLVVHPHTQDREMPQLIIAFFFCPNGHLVRTKQISKQLNATIWADIREASRKRPPCSSCAGK